MGFKDPSMVGEESLEGVSQEVDEEQPQSSGKQDGTQHRSGLRWQIVSAKKRHNTAHSKQTLTPSNAWNWTTT